MKQKPTFKSILLVASFFSLLACIYVNWHSNTVSEKTFSESKMVQTQLSDEDEDQSDVTVPNVTVLGRVFEIAHKLIEKKN